jgi:hypothetical protein
VRSKRDRPCICLERSSKPNTGFERHSIAGIGQGELAESTTDNVVPAARQIAFTESFVLLSSQARSFLIPARQLAWTRPVDKKGWMVTGSV